MSMPPRTMRNAQAALLEVLALLACLTLYLAAMLLGCSIAAQIYATVALLCAVLLLCWRSTGGGMHPCFLFLGLLLLFQGGRLLAFCMDPSQIAPLRLESSNGLFDPSVQVQRLVLASMVVSAVFLYAPVRIAGGKVLYALPHSNQIIPYILFVFLVTLPFLAWKNYLYLSFVHAHGGYIAIYLQHEELIAQAGVPVRVLSRVCATSFLVYFAYERPGRRLAVVTAAFFSVSVMELLVGLRGDVMLTAIGCLFLWKLKRGTHFTLRSMFFLGLALAIIGQVVAGTRENQESSISPGDLPRLFLFQQGTSIEVPAVLISNYEQFARRRLAYMGNGFLSPPIPLNQFKQGQLLENDIGLYLNPVGVAAGYGLGGSYLADGYLLGGLFGVAVLALLLSAMLIAVARFLSGWAAPYTVSMMLCLVYAPRNSTAGEISSGLQAWLFVSAVLMVSAALQRMAAGLRVTGTGVRPLHRMGV